MSNRLASREESENELTCVVNSISALGLELELGGGAPAWFDAAEPLKIDDLRGAIGAVGAQPVALEVVRCGGRLQGLLLLLFSVAAGEDGGEFDHADECAAGYLRRLRIFEVSADGSGGSQQQEHGEQCPDSFHGFLLPRFSSDCAASNGRVRPPWTAQLRQKLFG